MANIVVAIVGENANGILECQSERFLRLAACMGFEGRLLNVFDPEIGNKLHAALSEGVLFAWGYAGVGGRLSVGGRNIWDAAEVPFISVLADAPYIMPGNHHVDSPWVVNGYIYREWLELQERHFRSPQVSALLPMGVLPNPARQEVPWSKRPRRMVFIKTGADPVTQRARWDAWPARLRPVLHECADALAARSPGPIAPVLESCLQAHSLVLDGARPMLFGVLHELDSYIRALRATTMARALLDLPVDIIGDGWDHVRDEGGRARFHPAIPASALDPLYAQTQIVVNVTPNFASGAHERVLRGFAAGSCVLSDNNEFARARLRRSPAYVGIEWQDPDLTDRVAACYHELAIEEDALEDAWTYIEQRYDPAQFVTRMAELAQLARMEPVFSGYALNAA
jgi:hypothetical protein